MLQHKEHRLTDKDVPRKLIETKGTTVGYFDLNNEKGEKSEPGTGALGKAPKLSSSRNASGYGGRGTSRISIVNTRSGVRILARYYKGFRRGKSWGQRPGSRVATDGARIQSVVKSRYQSNRWGIAKDKLMKHLSYLEFRPRAEFEKSKDRLFYSRDRSDISGVRVFEEAKDKLGYRAGYHKIILSPGDNSLNLTDYTREVMEQWQKSVGREFSWWAVNHYNTDHYHSHVVVAGKDRNDRDVELDREMLAECREISDRYLCRDRNFDRELDRIADIKTDQMMRRFDVADKLIELGIGRPERLQQILDLGLKTDDDYRKEWEALGLRKIYELGRPFEGIRQVSKEQVELEKAERLRADQFRDEKGGPDISQVFGADFGPETKDSQENDREKADRAGAVGQSDERENGELEHDAGERASDENLGGKNSGGQNPGQTQPGGWLQQQNTVMTEPASVPFGHDAKEQEHSDRDDDDGMRITAKGRI
ncbi:hypothetical protein KBF38_24665 [bacterium]|nr:hypothetical protein [bacterium]